MFCLPGKQAATTARSSCLIDPPEHCCCPCTTVERASKVCILRETIYRRTVTVFSHA